MSDFAKAIGALLSAVVGVAIVAVLVSRNSQTAGVLQSAFGGLSSILSVAVSPVTGGGGGGAAAPVAYVPGVAPSAAAGYAQTAYPFSMGGGGGGNGMNGLSTSPFWGSVANAGIKYVTNNAGDWFSSGAGGAGGGGGAGDWFSGAESGGGSGDWFSGAGDYFADYYAA